jgi:Tol biopolymer transport system component
MSQAVATGIILRFGLETGLTEVVNTNAYFPKTTVYQDIRTLSMTPDGRFIGFVANRNDNSGTTTCVDLWDAQSQATTLVSGDLAGNVATNSTCDWPTVDPTGRFVTFVSSAPNLVTNSLAGDYHVYRRDVQAGTTILIDADTNGIGSSVVPSTLPDPSSDGRFVGFESLDAKFVLDDRNHAFDVFVRDITTNFFDLISARDPGLPSATGNGQSGISPFAVSGDGRWVAFSSEADNLIANDPNAFRDVFVRDLLFQTNFLVSFNTNGASGEGPSTEASISSNGRFVAFTSLADDLVPLESNHRQDVFVRDLQAGTTRLASINFAGTGSGNHESYSPALSPDGRFVLFRSRATNLGTSSFTGAENLFVRDLQIPQTYALTTSGLPAGSAAILSPDGSVIGYNYPSGRFNLWSVQSSAVVFSNLIGVPPARLAISPNNQLIAFLFFSTPFLRAIDRLANSNWQISSSVAAAERAGLGFSGNSRFLIRSPKLFIRRRGDPPEVPRSRR